ncbi:MAG: O-antigen ligase family protein [Phycisphaerae bacterium]|nr:O-antigen ligase family protein [Phycisphaerae bacterium]
MGFSTRSTAELEVIDPQVEQLDWTICGVLIALLVFLPAAMGAHSAWAEAIGQFLALGALVALLLKLIIRPDQRFVWSWTYLPLIALAGYLLFQVVPLPVSVIGVLSPQTVSDRAKLFVDLPAAFKPSSFPVSFYPFGTWHGLRNLLANIAVFVVTVNLTRDAKYLRALLWAIAIIGTAEAVLSILQMATGAKGVYWLYPSELGTTPNSGSMPQHNFFSQFVNLSSGAALALVLCGIDQTFRRHDYTPAEMWEKLRSSAIRPVYILLPMLALNAAAVFVSLSRGGMIALAGMGGVAALLLAIRGGRRGMGVAGWFGAMLVVLVFAIVMSSGYSIIESRINSIANPRDRYDRLQMSKDTLEMWKQYPMVGIGRGAFRYVFPRFEQLAEPSIELIATHAENEFVEWLAEVGVIGSAIIGLFAAMVIAAFFVAWSRLERSGDRPSESDAQTKAGGLLAIRHGRSRRGREHGGSHASSLAIGIGAGLAAMLIQCCTDFAPEFLSVSCLISVFCGMIVNLAFLRRVERGQITPGSHDLPPSATLLRRRAFSTASLAVALAVSAPLLLQSIRAWQGETAWQRVDSAANALFGRDWKDPDGDAADVKRYADAAVQAVPGNVYYRYWRDLYLEYALDRNLSPAERKAAITPLCEDLQTAKLLCPTFGNIYQQLGYWEYALLDEKESGAREIRLGVWLSPNDATANLVAGGLDADEGHWDTALDHYRRAIYLRGGIEEIFDDLIHYYHRPDLLAQLGGDDLRLLHLAMDALHNQSTGTSSTEPNTTKPTTVATSEPGDGNMENVMRALQAHMDAVIVRNAARPDATPEDQAEMALLLVRRHELNESLPYFDRALLREFSRADWRLAYAQALIALDRDNEAYPQLQTVVREQRWNPIAQDLLEQLLVRRATTKPAPLLR